MWRQAPSGEPAPGAVLGGGRDPADAAIVVAHDVLDDGAVEQAPAGQLDDAAPHEGVGRGRVAGQPRAVDEDDVVSGAGQQEGGGRTGAAGADDDDVVVALSNGAHGWFLRSVALGSAPKVGMPVGAG